MKFEGYQRPESIDGVLIDMSSEGISDVTNPDGRIRVRSALDNNFDQFSFDSIKRSNMEG